MAFKGHIKSKQWVPSPVNEWLSANHDASLSKVGSGNTSDYDFDAELQCFLGDLSTIMASSATIRPPLTFVSTKNPTINVNMNKHLCLLIVPIIFAAIKAKEIIDHLHNNNTLKTCYLVCKAWLLPIQYHLLGEFQSSWIAPTKLTYIGFVPLWEILLDMNFTLRVLHNFLMEPEAQVFQLEHQQLCPLRIL